MKPNSKITDSVIAGAVIMAANWALDTYVDAWVTPPADVYAGIVLLGGLLVGYLLPERRA